MRSTARLGLALLFAAGPAQAQVGHDPAHSPYRSLRYGQFVSFTAGYFNGDGGVLGAAAHRRAPHGFPDRPPGPPPRDSGTPSWPPARSRGGSPPPTATPSGRSSPPPSRSRPPSPARS